MTPLPEAFPSTDTPRPLIRRQVFRRSRGCSHDSAEIRSFSPISRIPFFFSFSFFSALLYSPAGEIGPGLFSFHVYLISRAPHNCPSFLLSSAVFLSPRPSCYPLSLSVHPFLCPGTSRGSGSQVTLKNLADGRKIGDTYIIHCVSLFLSFLPQRRVSCRRTYVFN